MEWVGLSWQLFLVLNKKISFLNVKRRCENFTAPFLVFVVLFTLTNGIDRAYFEHVYRRECLII